MVSKEKGKDGGRKDVPKTAGIPLGTSTHPSKESHQKGNEGAGVFTWRAGRGPVT